MLRGKQNGNIPCLYSLIDSHADFLLTILKLLPFAGHTRGIQTHFQWKNFSIAKCGENEIFVGGARGVQRSSKKRWFDIRQSIDRNLSDTDCKVHVTKRREREKADQLRLTFSFYSFDLMAFRLHANFWPFFCRNWLNENAIRHDLNAQPFEFTSFVKFSLKVPFTRCRILNLTQEIAFNQFSNWIQSARCSVQPMIDFYCLLVALARGTRLRTGKLISIWMTQRASFH